MAERFFLTEPVVDGKTMLSDDQAHHLSRVMRAQCGDEVTLFDGRGNEHLATIDSIAKRSVSLTVASSQQIPDPNQPEIIIASALPKGDRQKFLIEKLVELGTNRFIPLRTRRGVAAANSKVIARMEKQVIEASKQCRRDWLMQIDPELDIESLKDNFRDFAGQRLLGDPRTDVQSPLRYNVASVVAIGPEGGFTDDESNSLIDDGWTPVCFSPNVLRIETAAVATIAILRSKIN